VTEGAITAGKAVVWVVREADGPRLALAAPVSVGDDVAAVAYARLPLSRATASLDAVDVPGATYVALRQGGFTLAERGDGKYAESAERMAEPVAGTGLRVAAGLPPRPAAFLGLGAVPSFIAGG